MNRLCRSVRNGVWSQAARDDSRPAPVIGGRIDGGRLAGTCALAAARSLALQGVIVAPALAQTSRLAAAAAVCNGDFWRSVPGLFIGSMPIGNATRTHGDRSLAIGDVARVGDVAFGSGILPRQVNDAVALGAGSRADQYDAVSGGSQRALSERATITLGVSAGIGW